jgi:chromosome segregation ATPase
MDAQARRAEEALEIEAAMGGALEEVEHPLAGVVRDLRARNAQLEVELKATRSITAELIDEGDSLRKRISEARRQVDGARTEAASTIRRLERELVAARGAMARGAMARASAPAVARMERHELSDARRAQERLTGELAQVRLMLEAVTSAKDLADLLANGSARMVALKAKLPPGFIDSMHPVAISARVLASGIAPMPPSKERMAATSALYGMLSSFLAG